MPGEFLKYILRQQLQNHSDCEIRLLELVALVQDVCEVQVELPYMGKADVLRVEKGTEPCIIRRAHIEGDFMVELTDGNLVELLAGEADVAEVCGTIDLGDHVSLLLLIGACHSLPQPATACHSLPQPVWSCSTHMLYNQSL
jgi:hypothetical protein